MSFYFTDKDIENIGNALGVKTGSFDGGWTFQIQNNESKQSLVVTIYNKARMGEDEGVLISVQSHHGYFEIHNCINYMVFEPDEVIFLNAVSDTVSCMIIGKSGSCSMFSNIKREILTADFSTLDPAVLLSAMQLQLTEDILPE